MKLLLKLIIFVALVAAVVSFTRNSIFRRIIQEPSGIKHIIVRKFNFSKNSSIEEWKKRSLSRKKTDYSVTELEGKPCVKAVSKSSASTLYYKARLSWEKWPFISWDWKVEEFPERKTEETLDKKKEFDFAAQVYVVFYSRFFPKAKAIQYVWVEDLPVGSISDSPYSKNVKVMVLQSGHSDEWKHEERNINDDFLLLFGEKAHKDVDAVAFMTDSDSTKTKSVAYYSDITLGFIGSEEEEETYSEEAEEPFRAWFSKVLFWGSKQEEQPSNT